MKTCPKCGDTDVIMFDADNDKCNRCGEWFPAVADIETVYCHACSVAGGADMPIYHLPPACQTERKLKAGFNMATALAPVERVPDLMELDGERNNPR